LFQKCMLEQFAHVQYDHVLQELQMELNLAVMLFFDDVTRPIQD